MTRDEFMDVVYSELHSDGDNYRANRIIDAADAFEEESILSTINRVIEIIDSMIDSDEFHNHNENAVCKQIKKRVLALKGEQE